MLGDYFDYLKKKISSFGPQLPQQCRIEDDLCLGCCTVFGYCTMIVGLFIYALWYLTLTEFQPASIWVATRRPPEVYLTPAGRNLGDYCERPRDYSCDVSKDWSVSPTGCANVSQENIPIMPLSQAAGDGVFMPTLWGYEEISVEPADVLNNCLPNCVLGTGQGPKGQKYCNCQKKSQSLFMLWVVEQDMIFEYQMHMQVPDLDVMAADGVNTPYCQGYLKDTKLDEPLVKNNKTICTKGDEDCLRKHYYLSNMPCRVRLKRRPKPQGLHYNQNPTGPLWRDAGKEHFSTDLWGNWRIDARRILQEMTDFEESNKADDGNPFKCSFFATGGSIVLQHFIEPFHPEGWDLIHSGICRIGHPGLIQWWHDHHGRQWPCFQVAIDITYLPFMKWNNTLRSVNYDMVHGHSTIQIHHHMGIAIVAKGLSGSVRQFSATAVILGYTSLKQIWDLPLLIIGVIISFGFLSCKLCPGPGCELYRRALCERVSTKRMVSAWVCRSVAALWTLEAADKLREKSGPEISEKITDLLMEAQPNMDKEKTEKFVKSVMAGVIRNSLVHEDGEFPAAPRSPQSESAFLSADLKGRSMGWFLANESRGNLTSADIKNVVEHGGEEWRDIALLSCEVSTGLPMRKASERFMSMGGDSYVQMVPRSDSSESDEEAGSAPSDFHPVQRPVGAGSPRGLTRIG